MASLPSSVRSVDPTQEDLGGRAPFGTYDREEATRSLLESLKEVAPRNPERNNVAPIQPFLQEIAPPVPAPPVDPKTPVGQLNSLVEPASYLEDDEADPGLAPVSMAPRSVDLSTALAVNPMAGLLGEVSAMNHASDVAKEQARHTSILDEAANTIQQSQDLLSTIQAKAMARSEDATQPREAPFQAPVTLDETESRVGQFSQAPLDDHASAIATMEAMANAPKTMDFGNLSESVSSGRSSSPNTPAMGFTGGFDLGSLDLGEQTTAPADDNANDTGVFGSFGNFGGVGLSTAGTGAGANADLGGNLGTLGPSVSLSSPSVSVSAQDAVAKATVDPMFDPAFDFGKLGVPTVAPPAPVANPVREANRAPLTVTVTPAHQSMRTGSVGGGSGPSAASSVSAFDGSGGPFGDGSPSPFGGADNSGMDTSGFGSAAGVGDSGGSDSKIVCTAMNNHYGFGKFRQAVWLRHSTTLHPAYQKGYHLLFRPLVKKAYEGNGAPILRAVLEHIARRRTADIWKQSRGRRDLIGAVERAIIEPICFVVGIIIK